MEFEKCLIEARDQTRPRFVRLTKDQCLSDDLLQNGSYQCVRKWPINDPVQLARLIWKIGYHSYLNQRQWEKNQKIARQQKAILQKRDNRTENNVDLSWVHRALTRLPIRWREVLTRLFYDGQTIKEIANAMNRPVSTIRTWRQRGQRKLRAILSVEKHDERN